jgi:hypothetical protein
MPEEIAGTAPDTADPAAVVIAAAVDRAAAGDPARPEFQVERFAVAVTFAPASANEDVRTIDAVWYAGAKVPRFDWRTGQEYDLILDMKGCRLDRLNNGGPLLDSHAAYGVADQLGVVRKAWAKKGTGVATIQFSKRDAVTPIWNDVKGGIIQNLSPGMWIYKKVDTTPKNQERKEFTAVDWEPFEISLVPVPGDANTTFMSAAEPPAQPSVVEQQRASAQEEHPAMTEQNQQVAGEEARQNEVALAAARDEAAKEAVRMERERAGAIRLAALPFKFEEKFVTGLIDEGVSLDVANQRIVAKLAARSAEHPQFPPPPPLNGADERDKRRAGMEASILFRGNPGDSMLRDAGREFAGMTLVDVARECLDAAGVKTRGMSRNEIARVALQGRFGAAEFFEGGMMTTSDFPNILANVANKTLRQAYEAAPRTFTPFCRQVSATDFKPINRVQLSDVPTLPKVNEKGEFHRTSLSDSKESYSLATFGEIVAITRKTIINDDLQALTRAPAGLGQAAANLESDTVWAVITANANLADGIPLFHANHKNLNVSNALAGPALGTARAAFRVMKAPKGTILNLQPRYLIVPAALEQTADQLIWPINLAATAVTGVVPTWVQSLVKVVEGRLDAIQSVGVTNWFMAADPSQIDTIEYCYLEGQQGVYIETRQGFDVDGVEIKARLDFAAAAIDYRGLCKNISASS